MYNKSGVVVISLQVGDYWLWSLNIFLIHRSLFIAMVLYPMKTIHPPRGFFLGGDFPPVGSGESGPPKENFPCKCIL
jgi:hypothetical protein